MRGLDYYTRTAVRVHLRRARRAERRRRRGTLRRPGRAARRAADAGHGLGGRHRADPARRRSGSAATVASISPRRSRRAVRRARRRAPRAARGAFGLLSEARSAGLAAQMDLGGRSLKGQLGHADALGARYVAIVGDGQTRAEGHAGRRPAAAGHRTPSCTPCCAATTPSELESAANGARSARLRAGGPGPGQAVPREVPARCSQAPAVSRSSPSMRPLLVPSRSQARPHRSAPTLR